MRGGGAPAASPNPARPLRRRPQLPRRHASARRARRRRHRRPAQPRVEPVGRRRLAARDGGRRAGADRRCLRPPSRPLRPQPRRQGRHGRCVPPSGRALLAHRRRRGANRLLLISRRAVEPRAASVARQPPTRRSRLARRRRCRAPVLRPLCWRAAVPTLQPAPTEALLARQLACDPRGLDGAERLPRRPPAATAHPSRPLHRRRQIRLPLDPTTTRRRVGAFPARHV